MRTGFLGTGRITKRLVGAIAGEGAGDGVIVTRRNDTISSELAARYPALRVADDPQHVLDESDAVFICLPGDRVPSALEGLRFRADHAVISVMNGVELDTLRPVLQPASDLSVTIPLPFVEQGGCPLPVYPDSAALRTLLGSTNPIIPVASEQAMAPFWVTTGTLASVMSELSETSRWLGQSIGDEEAAEQYVQGLFSGYLGALPSDGHGRFAQAVEELGTPGGFNARMLDALNEAGCLQRWRAILDHLYGVRPE